MPAHAEDPAPPDQIDRMGANDGSHINHAATMPDTQTSPDTKLMDPFEFATFCL
jgi:hypothetical protein